MTIALPGIVVSAPAITGAREKGIGMEKERSYEGTPEELSEGLGGTQAEPASPEGEEATGGGGSLGSDESKAPPETA